MKTRYAALLLAAAAPLALTACEGMTGTVATVECTTDQTTCLNEWFDMKFEEQLERSPITQTSLGRKTNYDKLDDFSAEAAMEDVRWWQNSLAEMEANFDYDELTDEAKLSYDMFKYRADRATEGAKYKRQEYIFDQMTSAHTFLPTFLLTQHRVESEADMEAFIARIAAIGPAMDQLLERAKANAAEGTRPPRFAYEAVIDESGKIISGAPFGEDGEPSSMWEGVEGHLAKLVEDGTITESRAEELREDARVALVEGMAPAYRRIIEWFEQDLANTDEAARGVDALTDGAAFYNHSLAGYTTTELTADEIHELGLSEVERIHAEMRAIMEEVEFEGDLDDFFEFTRTDPQFYFPDNEAGAQMYIDAATRHIEAINAKLPEFFGRLPKAPLEVRRVEPFREQDGAAQHYQPGTPDGSRPGIYYAHLSDMTSMPTIDLEAIAYHEGNPGHHMQLSIAQELEGVPLFRSQGGFISAYGEGWALYAEALAKEMGGYQDPYSDFGRLSSELWRAIRLVVDTGIHAKGWSEEQAIQYALDNSPTPETSARSEVQRYFVLPGQATSYKIGQIRIQQLRKKGEDELGDKFDIRGFHDTVLGGGSVPLTILEKQVDNWIAKVKAS